MFGRHPSTVTNTHPTTKTAATMTAIARERLVDAGCPGAGVAAEVAAGLAVSCAVAFNTGAESDHATGNSKASRTSHRLATKADLFEHGGIDDCAGTLTAKHLDRLPEGFVAAADD